MPFDSPASLRTYRNFKAIEPGEHGRVVRYFERNEEAIGQLDPVEFFDCLKTYTEALFHLGHSAKHLVMSDALIAEIFKQGLRTWHGEDVLAAALFQKAASHHNLGDASSAAHVLKELLKISPGHPLAEELLFRVYKSEPPPFLRKTRAAALACFLLAVPVVGLELFAVRPFSPEQVPLFTKIWLGLLGLGLLVLAVGEGRWQLAARRRAGRFARRARLKKRNP